MSSILKHCAFVHVPKTGGVWVTTALHRAKLIVANKDRHSKLPLVKLPIIATVRNPIKWYKSRWCSPDHQRRLEKMVPYDGLLKAAGMLGYDFNEWMQSLLKTNGFVTKLYEEYMGKNFERPKFICENENLTEELIEALQFFGERFNPVHIRSTPIVNNSNKALKSMMVLSPKLVRQIFESEEKVFKRFGYSMKVKDYVN